MTDIKITQQIYNDAIDNRKMPHRFVVSTNCLIPIKMKDSEYLILYNIEPDICETWYPMYSTVDVHYNFEARTYGQLILEFDKLRTMTDKLPVRINSIGKKIIENSNLNTIEIKDDTHFYFEYRIKYSKAQKIWSVYYIEFFLIQNFDPKENILNISNKELCLLPLNFEKCNEILLSSSFKNIPVVPNVIDILNDEEYMRKLKAASISI